jgi:hypothetical protein
MDLGGLGIDDCGASWGWGGGWHLEGAALEEIREWTA